MTRSTRNTKKTIFAIDAAPAAIPPNPKMAAITAIIKKVNVQRNMMINFWLIIISSDNEKEPFHENQKHTTH